MSIKLNDNVYSESNKPQDDKFGPFPLSSDPPLPGGTTAIDYAKTRALLHVPIAYRHKGLTMGLYEANGTVTEYWFRSGVQDTDLIVKATAGGAMTQNVTADVAAGAIGVNQVIAAGTGLQLFVETLLKRENVPTFADATAALVVTPTPARQAGSATNQVFELGTRLTAVQPTVSYTANDGGTAGAVDLQKDDVTAWTSLVPAPAPLTVVASTKYDGTVQANGGAATKTSNFGNAYPNPFKDPHTILILPTVFIKGVYPVFYGVHPGVANGNGTFSPPVLTSAEVAAGTKLLYESIPAQISVPGAGFGGADPAFLWFAIPRINGSSVKTFTSWYRSASNYGSIGGAGDLFQAKVLLAVTSITQAAGGGAEWLNDYDVYVTNFKTGPVAQGNAPTLLS